jgi:RNA polymerase sigma-70 factor, ECF subfamily
MTMTAILAMFQRPATSQAEQASVQLRRELDGFLRQSERRALVMAEIATRHREDALDIVQDAMTGFVRSYGHKPQADWGKLFYSVLSSRITDWQRRRKVRSIMQSATDEDAQEAIYEITTEASAKAPDTAQFAAHSKAEIYRALHVLPNRQREAFLLRLWEGMDVAETAYAMRVSEGSVKTHLSRALLKLRELLGHLQ